MQTNTTRSSNHLRACPAGATVGFTLMAVVAAGVAGVAQGQSAVGWGLNADGQLNQPVDVGQLRDITLGLRHTSALRTDGTVVCWGHNGFNQVGGLPAGLSSVVAINAGDYHTIALRADGTVVCWGDNIFQQSTVPEGLAPAVGVSAGEQMSGALHADGTVTLWGWDNSDGRLNVPANLGSVTKLELGMIFGTVLRTDGTTRYWGNFAPRIDASAVLRDLAAGYAHVLGLRPDGTVQAWGANSAGQSTVPAGLTNVAAVAAGRLHSLALKQDGSVVCWGSNARGQAPNPSPVTANGRQVAAGEEFSYGLTLAGGIAAPSIVVASATDPVCGLNNGAIDTTVANADFVFWTGPSGYFRNGADLTGLAAGAYTVTAVGHGGSVSQVVTLTAQSDTTAPVVTSYDASESIAAGIDCTAAVPDFTASVVAGDNCTDAAALVITQLPAAGTALGLGAHDITITVTDGSDNEATVTAVFTVTGTAVNYYVDADGDTFGAGAAVVYCNTTTPPGYATNNGDCDDTRLLYADGDSDTFGAGAPVACGVPTNTDCNDANNQVYPGRAEVCNGIDDNCAGGIDDGLVFNTYYVDSDNDGFGLRGSTGTSSCDRIAGAATNDADCNDGNDAINPKATEICDAGNVDEDCDNAADNADASASEATKSDFYLDADADTYGAGAAVRFCDLPAGHSTNSADCNDAVAVINPAAAEICDAANTDENCNGTADNGDSGALDAGKTNYYADADADTYTGSVVGRFCDLPANGWEPTAEGDCNDANATVYPGAAELCANDGTDNDCDGEANSDLESSDATPYYLDTDGDGFGAGTAVRSCTAIAGRVANNLDCDNTKLLYSDNDGDGFGAGAPVACGVTTNTDCNDASNAVYPGAPELCSNLGIDNDCDSVNTEEEASDRSTFYRDADADTFTGSETAPFCNAPAGYEPTNEGDCNDASNTVYPGAPELCSNLGTDNDCDGVNTEEEASDRSTFYRDADADTFTGSETAPFCNAPAGYEPTNEGDCNDASNTVYPGAVENCANDGIDNDCDGEANSDAEAVDSVGYFVDADRDGFGAGAETKSCTAISGSVTNNSDCNDAQKFFEDNDQDGFGSNICVPCGGSTNNADCDDASDAVYPGALENCANDGTDNDCDGEANSDAEAIDSVSYYVDGDSDTFGAGAATKSCTAVAGSVTDNTDCNDASNAIYPGALENCANDGTDNDCDGEANSDAEAVDSVSYYVDADGDTFGSNAAAAVKSCTAIAGSVTNNGDCNDAQQLFQDNDQDGFGSTIFVACVGSTNDDDCDDASNAVYPGAIENCANDGTDNDCDGEANSDAEAIDAVRYYFDSDADTFGSNTDTGVRSCTAIPGRVLDNTDCNDASNSTYPGAPELCSNLGTDNDCDTVNTEEEASDRSTFYRDADGDTFTGSQTALFCNAPAGYEPTNEGDCNDADSTTYPGAVENCANILVDNDCDGDMSADEAIDSVSYYVDGDQDGFGAGVATKSCAPIAGSVTDSTDCNDASNAIYPGAPELCSNLGTDNDCDTVNTEEEASDRSTFYRDADGDTFTGSATALFCNAPAGYEPTNEGDCNDADSTTYPGAVENCANILVDNDCDGDMSADEAADSVNYYVDGDQDGFGAGAATKSCAPIEGSVTGNTDCNDADASTYPGAPELCSNLGTDNDCDTVNTEEEASDRSTFYRDADGDTFTGSATALFCNAPAGYEPTNEGDCNDTDSTTYPGAVENCANILVDNDCDGDLSADEAIDSVNYYVDGDQDGFGAGVATKSCAPIAGSVTDSTDCNDASNAIYPGAPELCSNLGTDNDCDTVNTEEEASDRSTFYRDADGDTFTGSQTALFCIAPAGYEPTNEGDCNDADSTTYPGAVENCANDGTDNDCDGEANSDTESIDAIRYYLDGDSDTFGSNTDPGVRSCTGIPGRVLGNTDCNDADASTYPGAPELCSNLGTDNDCDTVNTEVEASDRSTFYRDADGDTFTGSATALFCNAPAGYEATNEGDCNDANNAVYPGAVENCANDGTDNDCDGEANSDLEAVDAVRYYLDSDADTFGSKTDTGVRSCTGIPGRVLDNTDCNDASNSTYPGAPELCSNLGTDNDCDTVNTEEEASDRSTFYRDADGDTFTGSQTALFCNAPAGYEPTNEGDCNDADSTTYPGAVENCANDGTDNDCDGEANSDTESIDAIRYYLDGDSDTFGSNTDPGVRSCTGIPGRVLGNTDCNDADASTYPGAPELCSNLGTDNDCDTVNTEEEASDRSTFYRDADGDTFTGSATALFCIAPPGYEPTNEGDCNDANNAVYPGAVENCANDGTDNDCDGEANSDLVAVDAVPYYLDSDADTFGSNTDAGVRSCTGIPGRVLNNTDCNDAAATVYPSAPEQCNDIDDNCNLVVDDGITTQDWYPDTDGDGYGDASAQRVTDCRAPAGHVPNNLDCNDANAAIKPGAAEVCNGIDDDCDTQPDDGLTFVTYYEDADADAYGRSTDAGESSCKPIPGKVANNLDCNDVNGSINPSAAELCSNLGTDNDCDGINTEAEADDRSTFYRDADGDTFTGSVTALFCTAPAGYEPTNEGDCNDADVSTYPGAPELCSNLGTDNDCDTVNTEEEASDRSTFYRDADGDTFTGSDNALFCTAPAGYEPTNEGDCNDADNTTYPGAPELCSNLGTDNDCDKINTEEEASDRSTFYRDADSDTFTGSDSALFCTAPAGYESRDEGDCNDANDTIYPGAAELCSNLGTDNDCDGVNTEEEASDRSTFYRDADGDTFTGSESALFCTAPAGYESRDEGDCNDANDTIYPGAAELCSNLGTDNDCDGVNTEEEASDRSTFYRDADGDNFTGSQTALFCIAPAGYEPTNEGDCNDENKAVYPGAPELCSNLGTDNDCDGVNTEEEASDRSTFYRDADGDGFTGSVTGLFCTARGEWEPTNEGDCNDASNAVYPGAAELCSNLGTDNDCDGVNTEAEASDRSTFYRDADGDGVTGSETALFCTAPAGYEPTNEGDCNDANPAIYPGAAELCNSIDDNCSGSADEGLTFSDYYPDVDGDGFGAGEPVNACAAPSGYVLGRGDGCPVDPNKQAPGVCGCGIADADINDNDVIDCKDVELHMVPMTTGVRPGEEYRVRVSAMSPSAIIALTGMQLAVKFDATRIALVDVEPVEGTPLSYEIAQNINNSSAIGTLRYAIGVDAGASGLTGPADLVDLVFTVLDDADVCAQDVQLAWFENVGTFRTVLVTPPPAVSVFPTLSSLLPLDLDITDPVLAGVPESVAIPADADSAFGALVAEPTVTATDNCTDPIVLDLVVNYPDASGLPDATAWPLDGMFPVGTTSLRWSSVDETGNMSESIRTITVHDYALADLSITLEGLQRGASTRSIRVTADGVSSLTDVTFNPGVGAVLATAQVKVSSTIACIEVKDTVHSLTSTTAPSIVGTRYTGSVTLLQGDSNDDDKVDIADFTLFVGDRSVLGNSDREPNARSNFDGNRFVNTADFGFISTNFFRRGESCTAGAAGDAALSRISVKELRRQGLGHLDGADLNRDGWVDMRDMQIFIQGGPVTGSPSAPEGSVDSGW